MQIFFISLKFGNETLGAIEQNRIAGNTSCMKNDIYYRFKIQESLLISSTNAFPPDFRILLRISFSIADVFSRFRDCIIAIEELF